MSTEAVAAPALVIEEGGAVYLPALYRMIRIYEGIGEQAAVGFAEPLRERLRALPVGDVTLPTEPRLVAYTEQAIAALVAEGTWTQEKADEVLSQ